jgi:hypothetical protein
VVASSTSALTANSSSGAREVPKMSSVCLRTSVSSSTSRARLRKQHDRFVYNLYQTLARFLAAERKHQTPALRDLLHGLRVADPAELKRLSAFRALLATVRRVETSPYKQSHFLGEAHFGRVMCVRDATGREFAAKICSIKDIERGIALGDIQNPVRVCAPVSRTF